MQWTYVWQLKVNENVCLQAQLQSIVDDINAMNEVRLDFEDKEKMKTVPKKGISDEEKVERRKALVKLAKAKKEEDEKGVQ